MSAPSAPSSPGVPGLPALPHTWRPRAGAVVATVVGIGLVVAMFGMWFGLPAEERASFNWVQIGTLLLFLAAMVGGLYGIVRTRLVADEAGLTVVNAYRRHQLEWAQVLQVNFRRGDPWVVLDLDDGTTVSVMAVQSADGRRARVAAHQLAALIAAHSRTDRND